MSNPHSFSNREGWIWFDGQFVDWKEAKTHVLTHTLHYGMGVFEGVRAYETPQGPAIFRLSEHTQRLFNSAKILNMTIPHDRETINNVQKEIIHKNNLQSAYLRPLCFYGAEDMGLRADNLQVHTIVAAWSWGSYLGEENMRKGIRVKTSSYTRHHVNVTLCRAKASGNYVNSMLALQEALRDGYDEALLLDVNGLVMEGSGENFFIVADGKIYTPPLTSCLDGITRKSIIQFAQDNHIEVIEKNITRDEVYLADEAFFTGTAAEVTPIRELDSHPIGNGKCGPITEQLQRLYFDVVTGKNTQYAHWLSHT